LSPASHHQNWGHILPADKNLLRVLHLEDSPRDAERIRHQLAKGGLSCHIVLVDNRDRFEAALTQEPFDLVLCDYNLPGYDGISALKYAQQARPDVPVIFISGTVGDEEGVRCLHLGATDYLLKNHLERLVPAVERAIEEVETRGTHRRTADKLRQSEALNRSLVEHLPQRMSVKDLNSTYLFCNSAFARDLGIEAQQIVGQDDFALFSRERAERYRAEDRQLMSEGNVNALDERYTVAGEEQWIHTIQVPYRDDQGKIVGVLRLLEDISDRKLVEAQRERLAALVDASPDFIGCADPKTTQVTYVNTGGRKMCGIGDAEDIGALMLVDVHPSWMCRQLVEVIVPAAIRDGVWQGDGAFLHRDGHEIPVSMVVLPHRGGDGDVDFVYTVSRDITDRKRTEQALRGERDRAQRYLDTAEVILLKLDLEGRIVLVNRYGCSLLGWTQPELLGRDWSETCLPIRARSALEEKRRQLLGGDLSIVESPVITRSGEERLIEWRNRLLRDDDDRVIGSFSSGTDITDRNAAVAALRTAEERVRFALQSADVGIWDMDYTTGVLRWSETIEAHYGLQPGTFGGTFEAFIERIHPDDRASVLETAGKAMQGGGDFSVLNRSIQPNGTVRWLRGAGRVFLGEHGEPRRAVGISQDVTARMHADAELKRLNDEIQLQRMRVFKATIRTVQDIVNNLLNGFQLVQLEGEGHLPPELLTMVDEMVQVAGVKLKTLGDLETVNENEMAIGGGIDYPGAGA
jgi:PAS domain S-box-containing protein